MNNTIIFRGTAGTFQHNGINFISEIGTDFHMIYNLEISSKWNNLRIWKFILKYRNYITYIKLTTQYGLIYIKLDSVPEIIKNKMSKLLKLPYLASR